MSTPDIHIATAADEDCMIETMVLAFVSDPVTRWTFADPRSYLTHWPKLARAFVAGSIEHGMAHYADGFAGAAFWFPPGFQGDGALLTRVVETAIEPRRGQLMSRIFARMAGHHPVEPHWHLSLIGVDVNAQGHGYGAALLERGLERVDQERLPAYLDSSNPANVPLYERHGFEALGTIQIDDAPPLVPMRRPAR